MTTKEYGNAEDPRSSIWTVSSDDLAKFFLVYILIYGCGSGLLVWLHVKRDAAPYEVASSIITGVSLIGIGVAPSLALVLIETWRLAMIFFRGLEMKLKRREEAIRRHDLALQKEAYEYGVRAEKARAKGEDPGPPPWERETEEQSRG